MRVAALYDIHGNLPALEAVIAEVRREGVDRIIVGGDVMPGPMPRECLTLLRRLEWPVEFIMGNGDLAALDERSGKISRAPEVHRDSIRWCGQQLTDEESQFVESWPMTARVSVDGLGDVVFCHATPRDVHEIFSARTDAAKLEPIFAAAGAPVVVCGHTHMQFDRQIGATRVVNAGSVGMTFGEAGAYWMLIDGGIVLRRSEYDVAAAAERILQTAYPSVEDHVARYILDRPSAEFIFGVYAKAELSS